MDINEDAIVEVVDWSPVEAEPPTVSIEEGANVEVPMIINNINME